MTAENDYQIKDEDDRSIDLEKLDKEDSTPWEIIEGKNRELTQTLAEMDNALARVIAQVQAVSAATPSHQQDLVVANKATVTISNGTIIESVIPPAKDMGILFSR